ncbi:MAG: hypothetical protein E7036_08360 [Opitutales bacterium]|nr:hypothetical protein [Opitutales bacterium]
MVMGKFISFSLIAFFATLVVACSQEKSSCEKQDIYAVKEIGGVPRLVINDTPVRPRMLYVSPTYFLLGSPNGRTMYNYNWCNTFIETAPFQKSYPNAKLSLRVPTLDSECKIAKLEVLEIDTQKCVYSLNVKGDKNVEVRTKNTSIEFSKDAENVDFLAIRTAKPQQVIVHFKNLKLDKNKAYRINLKIRAKKTADYFVSFLDNTNDFLAPHTRSFVGLQTKVAKDANVDLITFPIQASDFFAEGDMLPNYNNLKGALDEIIGANPDAKILVRIRFYPPQWWMQKYKEDRMMTDKGQYNDFASPSSERFRSDCKKVLNRIIDFCEANYGKNIMGYHPGGGGSSEWYYGNAWGPRWFGYGPVERNAWRKWVKAKYKTDDALKTAWKDVAVPLDKVEVPTPARRALSQYILTPDTMRDVADFNLFLQDEMWGIIDLLSSEIKRKVPNKICAFFYGYVCDYAGSTRKGPSTTGHYNLWKLLQSKNIDILSGPTTYDERDLGYGSTIMTVGETIMRNGKIWFSEDDIRTHRTPASQQLVTRIGNEIQTLDDAKKVLARDMAQQIIRNFGCWWMDLAGLGWYDDPKLWQVMQDFDKIEKDTIANPVPYAPDVAVVGDERSMVFVGIDGTAHQTSKIFSQFRFDLNRLATPFGHYLLNDVLFGKPINPKLYVFATDYALDKKQRLAMREKSKNTSAIFVWIPAYIDADNMKFSAQATLEATGFEVEKISDDISATVITTANGKKAGLPEKFGFPQKVKPLLSPKLKQGDIVYANYENGKPAVVLRGKHLFCGVAQIPLSLYTHMYKVAGVHIYSEQELCVYANGAYISVTCVDNNTTPHDIKLNIPSNKEVFDAISGEKIGIAPNIVLKMKRGDIKMLRLGKGNAELKN